MLLCLKRAIITSLLTISGLDKEYIKGDIDEHLEHNNLNDSYQSAYCRSHSTEAAPLKVHSDIVETLHEGSMTALIMLDLSAAFNAIYHPILLKRLVSSGGLAVKHPALAANGYRFEPRKRSKPFQRLISRLTTSWVADHVK